MSDGYVNIDAKINDEQVTTGLNNISTGLKRTEKDIKEYAKAYEKLLIEQEKKHNIEIEDKRKKIAASNEEYKKTIQTQKESTKETTKGANAYAGLALKVAGAAAAIKVAVDVVNDLTDAYKKQIRAETQLESAAKNNPYLDSTSVQTLKNYASEIQSYTTFGDEELLPMMAKLAAAGRTQDQIMQIMSAATDMAASGAFSLDGAVNNLNKSFGGLSGELGESIPEIKSLTAEQLKNGAAVELLAGRYKGIAAEVGKNIGTAEQLGNAYGDLKEELGAPFEKAMGPMRRFFTETLSGWASILRAKREANDAQIAVEENRATASDYEKRVKAESKVLDSMKKELDTLKLNLSYSDEILMQMGQSRQYLEQQVSIKKVEIDDQTKLISLLKQQERLKIEGERKSKQDAQNAADRAAREKAITDYISANTAEREKALQALELQAQTESRAVTEEERLSVFAQSYVNLVGNANGLLTAQSKVAVDLLGTTREIAIEADKQNASKEKALKLQEDLQTLLSGIEAADPRKESQKIADQLAILDDYYRQVYESDQISGQDKINIEAEYLNKRKILLDQELAAVEQEAEDEKQKRLEKSQEILSIANDFATQYNSIMTSISSLMTKQIEDEASVRTAELEKQYNDGAISAEEYEQKLTEIKQDAAKEKYKIDMWMWSSNLLSSVANTALGVTQALSSSGNAIVNMVLAGMIAAAGSAQLATIIANKPIPPAFATGGIVGGTSYTGDQVPAMLNSAEMILNAGQQRNLFDRINNNDLGGRNGDIKIYNSASNDVKATPQVTEDGVKIMIEKTVGAQMADGRFNKPYRTMQNNLRGTRYTN